MSADHVHTTQRIFRSVLAAVSHPGRLMLIDEPVDAPRDLGSALAAAALALFDREVTIWIAAPERSRAASWLVARTGCRLAQDPAQAQFALILAPEDALPLARWHPGTAEDPEQSATLMVRVDDCAEGPGVTLAGPGIEHSVTARLRGITPRFWCDWSANTSLYPMGIDCLFFDDRHVVGLPRTTRAIS